MSETPVLSIETGAPRIAAPGARSDTLAAGALGAIVLLGFVLRLIPVVIVPSMNWADEVFQSTEQAHRLVFGTGLVPWEFQLGTRSWLLPGAVAGLMQLSRLIGDGPDTYLPVIAGGCGLLAAVPIVCCFLWCRRLFGTAGAIVGALSVAVAPELVYFGDRALSEVVAAHLLVLALYLLEPGYRVLSRPRLFWGGVLLALVTVLRVQLAPAAGFIALWTMLRGPRARARVIVAGGFAALALAALLDTATLGYPLASVWRNVLYNVFYGVSASFSVDHWADYLLIGVLIWHWAFLVLLALAVLGARRMALPLVTALIVIASHSLIAHKEYRFIYPAIVLTALSVAFGLATLVSWAQERLRAHGAGAIAFPAAVAGVWCALSFQVWAGPMAGLRLRAHDELVASLSVADGPKVCGIGLYGTGDANWGPFGGYTWLHQNVPIYWPTDEAALQQAAPAFDVLLWTTEAGPAPPLPAGFAEERCFGDVCTARRAGPCSPRPMTPLPFPKPLAGLDVRR